MADWQWLETSRINHLRKNICQLIYNQQIRHQMTQLQCEQMQQN